MKRDLHGLLALRAVAALTVVVGHFGHQVFPGWTQRFWDNSGYAVDVFFVLSGFLLGYAFLQDNGGMRDRRQFLIARFSRLYPAYLLALLLAVPRFIDLFPEGPAGARTVKIAILIVATLTMTQSWIPNGQSWNDPAWSLSGEAFFYLVLPLFALLVLSRFSFRAALGLTVALALVSEIVLTVASNVTGRELFFERLPLLRVAPFLVAALVGYAYRRWPRPKTRGVVLAAASALLVASFLLVPELPAGRHVVVSGATLAVVWLLPGTAGLLGRWLDGRVMTVLGNASYGIYIYQAGLHDLARRAVGDGIYSAWGFAAFTALLIALSAASFRLYEVPARRHIERRFQRGEAAPPPVGEPATASVVPTRRSAPPF